jgi:hypothetical protein
VADTGHAQKEIPDFSSSGTQKTRNLAQNLKEKEEVSPDRPKFNGMSIDAFQRNGI